MLMKFFGSHFHIAVFHTSLNFMPTLTALESCHSFESEKSAAQSDN